MNIQEALDTLQIQRLDILKLNKAAFIRHIKEVYASLSKNANRSQQQHLTNAIKVMAAVCAEWDLGTAENKKKYQNTAAILNHLRNSKMMIDEKLWRSSTPKTFILSMNHYILFCWGQKQLSQEIRALSEGPEDPDAYRHYVRHFKSTRIKRLVENRCISMSQVVTNPDNMDNLIDEKQCPEEVFELLLNQPGVLLDHINQPAETFQEQLQAWQENPPVLKKTGPSSAPAQQKSALSSAEDIDAEAFLASLDSTSKTAKKQPAAPKHRDSLSQESHDSDPQEASNEGGNWVDTLEEQLNTLVDAIRPGRNYGAGEGSSKLIALERIQNCLLSAEMPSDKKTQQALYSLILSLCEVHRNPMPNLFSAGFKPHSYHAFQTFLKTQAHQSITTVKLDKPMIEKLMTIEQPDDLTQLLREIASQTQKPLQSGPTG